MMQNIAYFLSLFKILYPNTNWLFLIFLHIDFLFNIISFSIFPYWYFFNCFYFVVSFVISFLYLFLYQWWEYLENISMTFFWFTYWVMIEKYQQRSWITDTLNHFPFLELKCIVSHFCRLSPCPFHFPMGIFLTLILPSFRGRRIATNTFTKELLI